RFPRQGGAGRAAAGQRHRRRPAVEEDQHDRAPQHQAEGAQGAAGGHGQGHRAGPAPPRLIADCPDEPGPAPGFSFPPLTALHPWVKLPPSPCRGQPMGQVVAAAAYHKGKRVADIALDEGHSWASKPEHFVWIGLRDPGRDELSLLQRQFDLHELAMEDAIAQHTRAKLEIFGDALFMVLYSPIRGADGGLEFVETQLFAGKRYVISARYGHSAPYSTVRQRCEARPLLLEHGEDFVLYALLAFVIENYRPLLDSILGELEEIEQSVLNRPLSQAGVESIHGLRRDLLRLRRQLAPLSEICQELQQLEFPFIDKHMRPYFR